MPTTYYDDDFQSYSLGDAVPFGSWKLDGPTILNQIVAGNGPTGSTQSYRLFGQIVLNTTVTGYLTSASEFFAIRKANGDIGPVAAFGNGTNSSGQNFTLVQIQVEQDSTVSIVGPDSNVIANSGDEWFEYNVVNFFQINVAVSDAIVVVGSSTTTHVHVVVDVGLNGRSIVAVATTANLLVNNLANHTSEINRFILVGDNFYSAYTLTGAQTTPAYPHGGSPVLRANQAVAAVDVVPTTGQIRTSQALAEVDVVPDTGAIRVFQAVMEVDSVTRAKWRVYEA